MTQPTDEHYDAAYEAYYKAVNDFTVENRGRAYLVSRRVELGLATVSDDEAVAWEFQDKETADRFLIVKILECITNAVLKANK